MSNSRKQKPTNSVLARLSGKASSERQAVTLSLNKESYQRLTELAEKKHIKVSHIIDELVLDFLTEVDGGGRQSSGRSA